MLATMQKPRDTGSAALDGGASAALVTLLEEMLALSRILPVDRPVCAAGRPDEKALDDTVDAGFDNLPI